MIEIKMTAKIMECAKIITKTNMQNGFSRKYLGTYDAGFILPFCPSAEKELAFNSLNGDIPHLKTGLYIPYSLEVV